MKKGLFLLFYISLVFLYFSHLDKAGVFQWDPAYYSNESESGWQILRRVDDFIFHRKSLTELKSEVRASGGGIFPTGVAKPTFIWLLTLSHSITAWKGFYVTALSALFGFLIVGLVYLTGASFDTPETGMLSAVILALSPLHIYLARSGFPNGMAAFFFLLGIYQLAKDQFFWAGIMLGLAYSSHYGLLPHLLVLGICVIGQDIFNKIPPRDIGRKGGLLFLGFMAVLGFWEVAYRLIEVAAGPYLAGTEFHTYAYSILHQLFWSLSLSPGDSFHYQISFFPKLFLLSQGPICIAVLLMAIVWGVKNFSEIEKNKGAFWIWGQGIFSSILWLCNPAIVATRIAAFLLPFYALMIGQFLSTIKHRVLKGLMFSILIASFLPLVWKSIHQQSGYREGADFVTQFAKEKILVFTNGPQWRMLLGPGSVWNMPSPITEEIIYSEMKRGGIRYAAFDYRDFFTLKDEPKSVMDNIRERLEPVDIIPNAMACDPINVYDHTDVKNLERSREGCFIEIYDLRGMPAPGMVSTPRP